MVVCSSNQSMFYCELTLSYKSCTSKFRIWIKVWQQQEKLLILLKGSGTRYVTCGQAISSKEIWMGRLTPFSTLTSLRKMYNNIVPTLLFMVVFYRDFHGAKTYRKQKEKTNKQITWKIVLNWFSKVIILVNSLVRFLTNNITCLCSFSRTFP